jgi:alpha-2-macroglobulin
VREKAVVKMAAQTAEGKPAPAGSEVAVAAVDEGLLELLPNSSWNLLEAMMGRRGYGIWTASAQMQVVGKRHYGLKALPQGGGGGQQTTRELFDTLLLWQGRVPLDEHGEASVEVPLNDALTSFRIVAVASGGVALFGTGATTIRSTQDLMVLPGIAPLVREGDQFPAEFTVRNTSNRPMDVAVTAQTEGLATLLAPQTLTLSPGEAKVVAWNLTAPAGVQTVQYTVEANEPGGGQDRVQVKQQVRPAVPVRPFQATLLRWEGPIHQSVRRPADALPDRGGVQVTLSPTLTQGLDGVREWMSRYPYTCLEQKVSRAVALRDEQLWQQVTAVLPSYVDGDGLLKYFPTMGWGSEVLTAYVLAISHAAGWTLPPAVQSKLEDGLEKFVAGTIVRRFALPVVDLSLRKIAALEALARYGKFDPNLLSSVTIEPNLWPTSTVLDWWSLLQRVPSIADREKHLSEVEQVVRSRLNLQGTTMGFSTERADNLWWLMVGPDTNAIRLILHLLQTGQWHDDLPQLMRGALMRQRRGAWGGTVTNAWGVLAVEKFSQTFETTPVSGTTSATLAEATQQVEWAQAPTGGILNFSWPARQMDLTVDHQGTGNPWVTIQARAAIPLTTPFSSGYRITRTLTPVEVRETGHWSRGDIIRVRLEIEAQADMTWVVVSDPLPGGASHLSGGLRTSAIATQGEEQKGQAWPAFQERAFEAFRAYYEFVPKGRFTVEYTIRLNQSGRFQLPTTRVEALYAPEMFGEFPNAPLEVQP